MGFSTWMVVRRVCKMEEREFDMYVVKKEMVYVFVFPMVAGFSFTCR